MATLKINGSAEVVGSPPAFPFAARREYAEAVNVEYKKATGGLASNLPIGEITTPSTLLITSDKAVTIAAGSITLEAGGFILIYGGTTATNPPTVDNTSGSTATIKVLALGV